MLGSFCDAAEMSNVLTSAKRQFVLTFSVCLCFARLFTAFVGTNHKGLLSRDFVMVVMMASVLQTRDVEHLGGGGGGGLSRLIQEHTHINSLQFQDNLKLTLENRSFSEFSPCS